MYVNDADGSFTVQQTYVSDSDCNRDVVSASADNFFLCIVTSPKQLVANTMEKGLHVYLFNRLGDASFSMVANHKFLIFML
jgi:hypothetical protein